MNDEYKKLKEKYKRKLRELSKSVKEFPEYYTIDYIKFKKELLPKRLSLYEKLCNFSARILKIKPDEKTAKKLEKALQTCHLEATPSGVISFSILAPLLIALLGSLFAYIITASLFFAFFFILVGVGSYFYFNKLPYFLANTWRMKASSQMITCIFYIVTYMRHTSNLERAIAFASLRLEPPLNLDMAKILWDVQTGKFDTVYDSLDSYLNFWQDTNLEFVESFHLVVSSLFEPTEQRRLELLDKALDVILEETYEKMLHYAQNLKSPITMLHMLGVIMPVLGLVILPLVASFMSSETLSPYRIATYILMIYNIIIPGVVYFFSKNILASRPTGYGSIVLEGKAKAKKGSPLTIALSIFIIFTFIAFLPLIIHFVNPSYDTSFLGFKFIEYVESRSIAGVYYGPYGLGASILSLFLPLGAALAIGYYMINKTKETIKLRESSKKLELEFSTALFQLSNRLADGIPPEIAFGKVAEIMKDTTSGRFFELVHRNIVEKGFDVEKAIFDENIGAIRYFPSKLIESSMKVLLESSKKGPKIAAEALASMARYIKEIHRVDERLKDLLAEIISSMKSQVNVLAPAIASIVVGLTAMISTILIKLGAQLQVATKGEEATQALGGVSGLLSMFGDTIPTYYFQFIVGFYVLEIAILLIITESRIENGPDSVKEQHLLGRTLPRTILLYSIMALLIMFLFSALATKILGGALT